MARITVDDCLKQIPNRFKLVVKAAARARQIAMGADAAVDIRDDKSTVVALREIAAGYLDLYEKEVSRRSNAGNSHLG